MLTTTTEAAGRRPNRLKEHLRALDRYASLAAGHTFAAAGLRGLLGLSERVIWRAVTCGVCRGEGWVKCPVRLVVPCGVCDATGFLIGG